MCCGARHILRDRPKAQASAEGRLLRDVLVALSTACSLALDLDTEEATQLIQAALFTGEPALLSRAS